MRLATLTAPAARPCRTRLRRRKGGRRARRCLQEPLLSSGELDRYIPAHRMATTPYTAPASYTLPPFAFSSSSAAARRLSIAGVVWSAVSLYNFDETQRTDSPTSRDAGRDGHTTRHVYPLFLHLLPRTPAAHISRWASAMHPVCMTQCTRRRADAPAPAGSCVMC